ncbi:isochorismatase family protein [Pararobbsia silviterrae]|uniref:Isochorismatase family protein n=2 Tax=Pararobbsia silviterrae TaxID=1792498 RepID=A0A494Y5E7_9BURK|nr:isochorismatase family protein [Pararobbsia silviterrae]
MHDVDIVPASDQGPVLQARPEPIRLDAKETALIVIDMQNAYASRGGYLDKAGFDLTGARKAIVGVERAVRIARHAGMQIIFFQNGWDAQYTEAGGPKSPNRYKSNALKTMRRQPALQGTLLAKGGWDYELIEELKPQDGDIVMPKPRYSGFYNTPLNSCLRSRGIHNLVFCGIATNVCVESTLRDGFALEYFSVVLSDATYQAGPPEAHVGALFNIEAFFGWVSDTGALAQAFAPGLASELP